MVKFFSFAAQFATMSARPSELPPFAPHEGRHDERTHLFLGAMICSKAGSCPIHIRNISPTGAFIEGSIAAEPGEELILKRASLEVSARIVWKAGRRAGLAFTSRIHVADWMSKQVGPHQGGVDEIIQSIRTGGAIAGNESPTVPALPPFEADLEMLRNNLAELEKGLIGDVVVVATHPEIQLLDLALQSVGRMLANLRQLPHRSQK